MTVEVQLIEEETIQSIKIATKLDEEGKHQEALRFYKDGLKKLLEDIARIEGEEQKKKYDPSIEKYRKRIESIEVLLPNVTRIYPNLEDVSGESPRHEIAVGKENETRETKAKSIHIEEFETGHSFDTLLGGTLDETVTTITILEPCLLNSFQFVNFFRFIELCIKKCSNLKNINLTTNPHGKQLGYQTESKPGLIKRIKNKMKLIAKARKLKGKLRDLKKMLSTRKIVFGIPPPVPLRQNMINYMSTEC